MEEVASRKDEFIQANSPDGGFLQSEKWPKFQESFGRKTFHVEEENYWANIIEHKLPIVGKYFYIPRGPIISVQAVIQSNVLDSGLPASRSLGVEVGMAAIVNLAKKENAGWIRFDANNQETLEMIYKAKLFQHQSSALKIKKAPHDMQPRELFIVDLNKSEDELLAGMKSKTRYNIRLAQKHGIKAFVAVIPAPSFARINSGGLPAGRQGVQPKGVDSGSPAGTTNEYLEEFLRLVKITAQRDKITPHPDVYYRKMFETIPAENIKLYIAEHDGKIVAANINIFFGKAATYLHGASDHNYKNVMAPYLLQWQAMLHAKAAGCEKYDLGGIKTGSSGSWAGITRFKTGFSTNTEPIKFPGSYDIVLSPLRYNLYIILQRIKSLF